MNVKKILYSLTTVAVITLLSACDDDNDPVVEMEFLPAPSLMTYGYEVTVKNLTYAQPISPLAVLLHKEGVLWQIGEPASGALEVMAEGGNNAVLLSLPVALATGSGTGIVMPGMDETVTVTYQTTADMSSPMYLSAATMLVNTNDAFSGVNAIDVSGLAVDQMIHYTVGTYDAGTEKNSEMMGTIPGPADGGEGYNVERDDVNVVAMHPGVVTSDDGLTISVLTQAHKFDNPTLAIQIKRVQ